MACGLYGSTRDPRAGASRGPHQVQSSRANSDWTTSPRTAGPAALGSQGPGCNVWASLWTGSPRETHGMGKGLENRAGPRRGEWLVVRPIALGIAGEESSQGAWGVGVNVSSGVQEIPHLLIFCISLHDSSEPCATHPYLSPSDGLGKKLKLHRVFCLFVLGWGH